MAKINVLGTRYDIVFDDLNNSDLWKHDGMCDKYVKEITLRNPDLLLSPDSTEINRKERLGEVLRHEIIHAYCRESGVFFDEDENLVDWFALMMPKIMKDYESAMEQLEEDI